MKFLMKKNKHKCGYTVNFGNTVQTARRQRTRGCERVMLGFRTIPLERLQSGRLNRGPNAVNGLIRILNNMVLVG